MFAENPEISIVVPTLKEARNIPELVAQIRQNLAPKKLRWELIIVDDNSQDGTVEVYDRLRQESVPIDLIVRKHEKGLATAVVSGLRQAKAPVLAVMDADLSHPASSLPEFFQEIQRGADFVVGSRYIPGGGTDDRWTVYRYLNSKLACLLALPLTSISDPMSGFFAMTRQVWQNCGDISPLGYKIGLEIIVRGAPKRIKELPIHFRSRVCGRSKLTIKQQWLYLVQLMKLYKYRAKKVNGV